MTFPVLQMGNTGIFIKMLNFILIYHRFCVIITTVTIGKVFYLLSEVGCMELF